tara:strand:- start:1428 stop:1715 length:288 start_codon:yes stop_codon:yes gene_type:complete
MFEDLDFLWGPVILMVVTGISAYVLNFFKSKKNEISENQINILKINSEIKQIKRLMLIVAKITDRDMEKLHPDIQPNFEELVKDLLSRDVLGRKT